MYVNGTAGTQDNSAPPIATAPGMDGTVAHSGFTPARIVQFDSFFARLVFIGVGFGFLSHFFYFGFV